jgi:hypothetical protein
MVRAYQVGSARLKLRIRTDGNKSLVRTGSRRRV